jgi:1-acyl-sn-glycerol-3-phosphate acyltransferase
LAPKSARSMRLTETEWPARLSGAVLVSACERVAQRIFECFARLICRVWCPLRVDGRENLPDVPFLICANHSSHLDSIVLMVATGEPFRCLALLAARDYFFSSRLSNRAFGALLRLIPLDRSARPYSLRRTLSLCADFLNQGNRGLILFPEGRRSRTGDVGPFKRGVALFSTRLGLPVIPVCIEGTRGVMPRGRFFPRPGPVTVRIGETLWPRDDDSIVFEARSRILALKGNLP